ncbi:MAG: radical SAM protein [Acidobacteria bacterium]|nr:radical SAM protein [Acidobacteriota bacterium]MCA1628134.1 radical SAM protein [Acidobacteriota bacterium]
MLNAQKSIQAKETTWIIDHATGALTVEGLTERELLSVASDLLPEAAHVNCARPINAPPVQMGSPATAVAEEDSLYVFRVYHGSVVEGPGRRSVAQLSGCPILCRGCSVPQTHRLDAGTLLSISEVINLVLDTAGEPRDGVTVLGGEPFMQPDGLTALLRELKSRNQHLTLYSGYTIEELRARTEASVHEALSLADILIEGRFVVAQSQGAGEWRGSINQRIINNPATWRA